MLMLVLEVIPNVSKSRLYFYIDCHKKRRLSVKQLSLESSQNSQENIFARDSFLIKLQA